MLLMMHLLFLGIFQCPAWHNSRPHGTTVGDKHSDHGLHLYMSSNWLHHRWSRMRPNLRPYQPGNRFHHQHYYPGCCDDCHWLRRSRVGVHGLDRRSGTRFWLRGNWCVEQRVMVVLMIVVAKVRAMQEHLPSGPA